MHIIPLCISQIACLEGHTGSDQPEESCSPAGESQPSSPTSGSSERNGLSTDDLHSGTEAYSELFKSIRLAVICFSSLFGQIVTALLIMILFRKRRSVEETVEVVSSGFEMLVCVCLSSDADWGDVPQTARLDCSVYRAKAKLAQGSQRKRPSRSKLRESAKGSQAPNQSQVR